MSAQDVSRQVAASCEEVYKLLVSNKSISAHKLADALYTVARVRRHHGAEILSRLPARPKQVHELFEFIYDLVFFEVGQVWRHDHNAGLPEVFYNQQSSTFIAFQGLLKAVVSSVCSDIQQQLGVHHGDMATAPSAACSKQFSIEDIDS